MHRDHDAVPWKAHPHIAAGSIGWRTGLGEEYISEFTEWFELRQLQDKWDYADKHPEPTGWEGFYARRGLTGQAINNP